MFAVEKFTNNSKLIGHFRRGLFFLQHCNASDVGPKIKHYKSISYFSSLATKKLQHFWREILKRTTNVSNYFFNASIFKHITACHSVSCFYFTTKIDYTRRKITNQHEPRTNLNQSFLKFSIKPSFLKSTFPIQVYKSVQFTSLSFILE